MLVLEQDRKDAILQSMADKFMREILASTVSQAKSIEEISGENGIPISTCYRRVHELLSLRLLRIERTIITDQGKKFETYRSLVKEATVNFSKAEVSVEVTFQPREPEERLHIWKTVRGDEMKVAPPVG